MGSGKYLISSDRVVGNGNIFALKQGLFTSVFPGQAGNLPVFFLELPIETTAVEIALELGNVSLLAIVAAMFIKDLDEDRQQGVNLGFADHVGFLVNIEQDAPGGNGGRPFQITTQDLVAAALGQKKIKRRGLVDQVVFEHQGKDF